MRLFIQKADCQVQNHGQKDREQNGRNQGYDTGQVVRLEADVSRELEKIYAEPGKQEYQAPDHKQ